MLFKMTGRSRGYRDINDHRYILYRVVSAYDQKSANHSIGVRPKPPKVSPKRPIFFRLPKLKVGRKWRHLVLHVNTLRRRQAFIKKTISLIAAICYTCSNRVMSARPHKRQSKP